MLTRFSRLSSDPDVVNASLFVLFGLASLLPFNCLLISIPFLITNFGRPVIGTLQPLLQTTTSASTQISLLFRPLPDSLLTVGSQLTSLAILLPIVIVEAMYYNTSQGGFGIYVTIQIIIAVLYSSYLAGTFSMSAKIQPYIVRSSLDLASFSCFGQAVAGVITFPLLRLAGIIVNEGSDSSAELVLCVVCSLILLGTLVASRSTLRITSKETPSEQVSTVRRETIGKSIIDDKSMSQEVGRQDKDALELQGTEVSRSSASRMECLWEVLTVSRNQYAVSVVLMNLMSFVVFPGYSLLWSTDSSAMGSGTEYQEIILYLFQLGDAIGRLLASFKIGQIMASQCFIMWYTILRFVIFIPLFILTAKMPQSSFFANDAYRGILMLSFAITNGHGSVLALGEAFVCLQRHQPPERISKSLYASLSGRLVSILYSGGIALGTLLALLVHAIDN